MSINNLKMEECFVVEVDENNFATAVPVLDANYDNIGIVRVYPASFITNGDQVITVTQSPSKIDEFHPLEAELRLDKIRQNELARLTSTSVIQALPDRPNVTSVVQTLNRAVLSDAKEKDITLHSSVLNHTSSDKEDDSLEDNGSKILWVAENPHALSYCNPLLDASQPRDDLMEIEDAQIPLTVQNCSVTGRCGNIKKELSDSGSEDDTADVRPVFDHEPDPDPPDPAVTEDISDMTNRCYMCFKKFRQKKNMYAHIRKIHSTQPKIVGGIVCPLCKMNALRQEHLRNHLETLHQIKIKKEERQFDFLSEFITWKLHVERETGCAFISKSSSKILSFNQTKTYFKCQRSGSYEPEKLEKRIKKPKAIISYKMGATCPAAMELTENANGVTVTFWSTHVGHSMDILPDPLAEPPKEKITGTSSSELSWEDVLVKGDLSQIDSSALNTRPSSASTSLMKEKEDSIRIIPRERMSSSFGRKPRKTRTLKTATQAMVIEKASNLLRLVKSSDVHPEARPQICSMIDNLIATVSRRVLQATKKRRKSKRIAESSALSQETSLKRNGGSRTGREESPGSSSGSEDDPLLNDASLPESDLSVPDKAKATR